MNYGTYEYFLNGKPTGVLETFDIKYEPPDKKITNSIRSAKPFNTTIMVEVVESLNYLNWFSVSFQKDNVKVHAIYEFDDDSFYFQRKINSEIVNDETINLPKTCEIFPLMRCFQGQTILQVAKNQEFTTVLVPDIQNTNNVQNLLESTFDKRRAENLGKESIAFYQENSITSEANVYQYFSKHYEENSRFWIDDDGLLIAYRFAQSPDKIWEVFLTTNEHR